MGDLQVAEETGRTHAGKFLLGDSETMDTGDLPPGPCLNPPIGRNSN